MTLKIIHLFSKFVYVLIAVDRKVNWRFGENNIFEKSICFLAYP